MKNQSKTRYRTFQLRRELTAALADNLRRGCIVCTTDYRLGDGFELLEQLDGANDGVGGRSTAYLFRKVCDGRNRAEALHAEQLEEARG